MNPEAAQTSDLDLILDDLSLEKLAEAARETQATSRFLSGRPTTSGVLPKFKPYPHQTRALERFRKQGSRIFAHGTGTGKSFTSVLAAEDVLKKEGGPAIFIVPDQLKTQFEEEAVEKFTNKNAFVVENWRDVEILKKLKSRGKVPDYIITGWAMLRRHADALRSMEPTLVVADEAHKMRDPSSSNLESFMKVREVAPHAIVMTGSISSNTPSDLMPLLYAVSNGEISARGRLASRSTSTIGWFEDLLGKRREKKFVTKPTDLMSLGETWVDYVDTEELGKSLPPATTEYVPVEMSSTQWDLYQRELQNLPPGILDRIIRGLVPRKNTSPIFTRIIRARQAAQSTAREYGMSDQMLSSSPKVEKIADDAEQHLLEDRRNRTVIYSNFVNGGVDAIHYALEKRKIPHSIFIGAGREIGDTQIDKAARQKGLDDFKQGRTRVIVLSGAGTEGLDLKDANMFQAMEGHFNPEVIKQAQARVRRLEGQQAFKPEDRRVVMKRYVSSEPHPGFVTRFLRRLRGEPAKQQTTDEWVYNVAAAKNMTNEGVRIALGGAHPLQPGEDPTPESWLLSKPHKYLSRVWNIQRGEWKYKYARPL